MTRLHKDFVKGTLSIALSPTDTTMVSAALTAVGPVTSPDVLAITLDPDSDNPEIVHITDLAAGVATATIVRGQETDAGGGAARSHSTGTKLVHALTAADAGSTLPAGVVTMPVGPAATHLYITGDLADAASWFGETPVYQFTWTPTVEGWLTFFVGPDWGDSDWAGYNFDFLIWQGNSENVDYPGVTAGSGSFDQHASGVYFDDAVSNSPPGNAYFVTAGQVYTIQVVDWMGVPAVGHTVDMSTFINCLAVLGGITPPYPPLPPGVRAYVERSTDGSVSLQPLPPDPGPQLILRGNYEAALDGKYGNFFVSGGVSTSTTTDYGVAGGSLSNTGDSQIQTSREHRTADFSAFHEAYATSATSRVGSGDAATYLSSTLSVATSDTVGNQTLLIQCDGQQKFDGSTNTPTLRLVFQRYTGSVTHQIFMGLSSEGDIEIIDGQTLGASHLVLRSPDGTRYRINVANDGTLGTTAL